MKRAIRHLIIGKDVYIESGTEFKQVMLSGYYALISLVVLIVYSTVDLLSGILETSVFFIIPFLFISSTLVLHRHRLHCLANSILFPTFNIALFLIVSSESIGTHSCIFFLPIALGSAAVFNYTHRKTALAFALLSFLLWVMALTGNFSILTFRNYAEEEVRVIQVLNFAIAFPTSVMAIYLLIKLSHYNAKKLMESNGQMEKLNEELDRFVYSTSHDLRAPLLSVMGLLKLAETADEKEVKKYHQMMQGRLASLDKFIKDITDYSRNNRLQVVKEPVPLSSLANEIWESLRYSTDALDIEFINDIGEELTVINDSTRLRVVLGNLITNAIRYHDQRKEKKYIRIYYQATLKSFSLHIEDNGQGIAPELQSKIFEMFFRGNESSQGSGLGLYIVKETLAKLSVKLAVVGQGMKLAKLPEFVRKAMLKIFNH